MMRGIVNRHHEPMLRVELRDSDGVFRTVDAMIDTGFSGNLTLPASFVELFGLQIDDRVPYEMATGEMRDLDQADVTVKWFNDERIVTATITGTQPLLGMRLLAGTEYRMFVETGGDIEIRPLPFSES